MKKRKLVLICTMFTLAIGIYVYSSSEICKKTAIDNLKATNVAAVAGSNEWTEWVTLVESVFGWIKSTFDNDYNYCRCHMSVNACMGGNQISFRKACYIGETEVDCFDYNIYCQED